MSSTIINFFINKFLANFLEIDTSKTDVSIFTGVIKLKNLKIKSEIFQTYNIPYFELLQGYVGSLDISLKMPFFYNNPIKVIIKQIFAHAKQKDINKLKKDEELHTILEYKKNLLLNMEQLFAEIEEIKRQNKENINLNFESFNKDKKEGENMPEIVQKIINNLLIEINDIVIRFDDDLSYKGIPFSMGIILQRIVIRSTGSDFKLRENPHEVIPLKDINYKVAMVEALSVFMDLYDFKEELDYKRIIANKKIESMNSDLKNYLKDVSSFYSYCINELEVNSKNFNKHEYLLYQLNLLMRFSLNNNVKNKKPIFEMNADIPQILLNASFRQIKVFLKFLAYINLNSLYQNGISRQYFNKKLTLTEKKSYVDGYESYLRQKYIEQNNIPFPIGLKNMEEHINYREIRKMRFLAMKKYDFISKLKNIEKKIEEEKTKIILMDDERINKLKKEKEKLLKKQKKFLNTMFTGKVRHEYENFEQYDVEDTYITLNFNFKILITSLTLFEYETKEENGNWKFKQKVMTISIPNLIMELRIFKVGMIFLFTLENIVFTDERIKNPNYNKIIFGDLTSKGNLLYMIFEINPKFEKSDFRCKIRSEREMYIIMNDYTLQYIIYQSTTVFTTTIVLEEYSLYAKDSVLKYIKEGYEELYLPSNFSHTNIFLDINLDCPILIVPIDIFDINNNQCMLLSLGKLILKSILPPRVESHPEIDYKTTKDENIMYDIYKIILINTRMYTIDNCIEKNKYRGKETLILKDVDFYMDCKVLIQYENPFFDNVLVNIVVNKMFFQINEFQILLLINFLGNYFKNGYRVQMELKSIQMEEEKKLKLSKINQEKPEHKTQKEKTDLIPYKEKKKRAEKFYKNYIKSFQGGNYHRVSKDIKNIHDNKKSVMVDVVLKHVNFSLQKNYADNTVEKYLEFEMKNLDVETDIAENGDLVVIVEVKSVTLYDYDKDQNKNFIINQQYQCLIGLAEEGVDRGVSRVINEQRKKDNKSTFIDYQLLMTGDELNNIVHVNNLHITVSLESLLHMYQFSMYYTEIYLDKMRQAEIWHKLEIERRNALDENKLYKDKIEEDNEENLGDNRHYLVNLIKEDNINKIKLKLKKKNNTYKDFDQFEKFLRYKYNQNIAFERKRVIMRVLVKVNNIIVKLPIDPKNIKEPLYNLSFNLVYNQNSTYIYTDFFTLPSKRVIGTFYEENTNSMNTSVSNFDLDMVYYKPMKREFTRSIPEERLITNFRMSCVIDSFLVLNSEQNVMVIDVILEPLLFAFGMWQVRKSWNFYFKVMEYVYLLFEKYIPYAKPYDDIEKNRKRLSLRDIVEKVMKQQKIKRTLERGKKIKNNKKNINTTIVNIHKYNYLLITNVKSNRMGVIFFDNTKAESKSILFDVRVKKFYFKYLQNSIITDKHNVTNALYEILTGDELPINQYHRNRLSMYYSLFCSTQMNYYNILTNKFEPIIERFETNLEMMQVAPMFRAKTNVIINDIINYNLSIDSIIALNSFITKFTQSEKNWEIKELSDPVRWRSTLMISETEKQEVIRNYDIILQFINNSGVELVIFFESNLNNRIKIFPNEVISYTSNSLYEARGLNRRNTRMDRTNFGIYIQDSYPIKNINFRRTNYKQFKINIELQNKKYIPLYLSIKVESSHLLNKVYFSSAIAFFNETEFGRIKILIDSNIDNFSIIVEKESKAYIPITWLICQPPNSSISIRLSDYGQSFKICDHITDLFQELITTDKNLENIEKDLNKKYASYKNPVFDKIKKIEKYESSNMKKSKYILVNNKDNKNILNFDYFMVQSKDVEQIIKDTTQRKEKLKTIKTESKKDINESTLNELEEKDSINIYNTLFVPEINYEYVITIRPSLIIVNKIPFTLYFSYNDKNLRIETLATEDLYDFFINSMDSFIKVKIKYFDKFYSSEKIKLVDIKTHQYIDLKNDNDNYCLKCHMVKRPKPKHVQKPKNYFEETKGYSINTYELIFFFDYLITNRLTQSIYICPSKNKAKVHHKIHQDEINTKSHKIAATSLFLISFPDFEQSMSIKDDNSNWSDLFDINTVGVNSSIQLDNQFNQTESKELKNEIAIIIKSSELYDFSIIIIFEPKYVIINNLGFDIVYNQENNSLNKDIILNKGEFQALKYENINKHFRIGIYDQINHMTNYSGYFNLENNEDLDLKIPINPSSYKFPKDANVFSYDGRLYYILVRLINQTYDKGTVYILLCHSLFPYLEIVNNLDVPLRITEKSTGHSFIIYNNNKNIKSFPFTWENPCKYKDELTFEVYNRREEFSFSVFNEGTINIKEQALSLSYSVSSKNKTETRSFKIEIKKILSGEDLDFLAFILRTKSLNSSSYSCFIKGFGISLINQERKEVFYISFYNIKAKYITNIHKVKNGVTTINSVNYILLVDNFQIDYCLNDSFKIIVCPTQQLIPSNESEVKRELEKYNYDFIPLIRSTVTTKTIKNLISNEQLTSFENIELSLQKIEVKLEEKEMINLINMYSEFMEHFDYFSSINKEPDLDNDKEPLIDIELHIPIQKLMKENENAFRNLINNFFIDKIKMNLTLRLDAKYFTMNIPHALQMIVASLINLGSITNCPLTFSSKGVENLYISWYDLSWKIIDPYITEGIIQVYRILGSLDIIGNPVNLLKNITEGVLGEKKFGNEYKNRRGFSLGKNIIKSFGGLMAGVVGGTFNSIQRFSTTLLVSIQTVMDRDRNDIISEEENEPDNVLDGMYQGVVGIGKEIGKGVSNLFTLPCKRGQNEGCKGFFKGLCKGLFGLILSPIAGIFKFVSSVSGGIKNSCFTLVGRKKLKTERFRFPRIIVEGEDMFHSYHENKAEAKEMLNILQKEYTDNILYAEDFICANNTFKKKFSTAILTDKALYVIYNSDKLIFEAELNLIEKISIHFLDNNFIVFLKMKNNITKGFKVHKDYSKIPTELFDLISIKIEKIKLSSAFMRRDSGLQRGIVKNILNTNDDNNIDESSYGKTITTNTYYSMKTLDSKIDKNY